MMTIKEAFSKALRDRSFVILALLITALVVVIIILGAVNIRPSDLQVPTRYSAFGITNIYRDKWYYAITFILFALTLAGLHGLVTLKLYAAKGRDMALAFLWLTLVMMLITASTVFAILRLISFGR